MTPDDLQQEENLGRKIAAALTPLGFDKFTILLMVRRDYMIHLSSADYREIARRSPFASLTPTRGTEGNWARSAGVAAYFEEQGK